MTPAETLRKKIEDGSVRVGVIGLGYVGLPLARAFERAGVGVLGFDVDDAKIEALAAGRSYIRHLDDGWFAELSRSEGFEATADFSRLPEADCLLVCVPTPLGTHLEPDLSYVERTAETIGEHLREGQLVVLESTTYPGTTRDVVLPRLAARGLAPGEQFFLAFSPEREDPGRADRSTTTIPKVVGGIDDASADLATDLYAIAIGEVVRVSSAEVAESSKLLENIFRAVNIALVNEMKVVLTKMDIDVWETVEAASTKPFGFMPFYPGPGLGGHCIPIDPFYLAWRAREAGQTSRFIELAGEVNRAMPDYVIDRLTRALNERATPVRGANVLVLGLAYKPDVGDVRESPSLELIERLRDMGAEVSYNDPHVPKTHRMRNYDLGLESVDLTPERLIAADCVLIATDHSAYDWAFVAEHAPLIVDTRGAVRRALGHRDNVVQA